MGCKTFRETQAAYDFICGDVSRAEAADLADELDAEHAHRVEAEASPIRSRARELVADATALHDELGLTVELRTALITLASTVGITLPPCKPEKVFALHLRSVHEAWWARKLRRVDVRRQELGQIRSGVVRKGGQVYCSDLSLQRVQERRHQFRELSQSLFVVGDDGTVLPMDVAIDGGQANPRNRFAELIVHARGLEAVAGEAGHGALMVTLTCPSRFHASSPRYDGSSPTEAQDYLNSVWQRARAALHRAGLRPYGVRIAEPHGDGCPHWHVLLWAELADLETVAAIIRRYAMEDSPTEAGAAQHRMTVERIDPARGSAVGYLVKYITKNLDGRTRSGSSIGEAHDHAGQTQGDAVLLAERVQAWASIWAIRQFQFFGSVPVGPYRELRRVADVISESPELEALRTAARAADWQTFEILSREYCPELRRVSDAVEALREGNVRKARAELGRYGEPIWRTVAVRMPATAAEVVTRTVRWAVMSADEIRDAARRAVGKLAPIWADALILLDKILADREGRPWTRLNNCTDSVVETRDALIRNDGDPDAVSSLGRLGRLASIYAARNLPDSSFLGYVRVGIPA